jgi:hypothetical protein
MFAGSQGVFPIIRAGAVRFAPFPTTEGHTVGLARALARYEIIRPQGFLFRGTDVHTFFSCPFLPLVEGLFDQIPFVQAFDGGSLRRGRRQAQGHLFFQDQGKGRPEMFTCRLAEAALKEKTLGTEG